VSVCMAASLDVNGSACATPATPSHARLSTHVHMRTHTHACTHTRTHTRTRTLHTRTRTRTPTPARDHTGAAQSGRGAAAGGGVLPPWLPPRPARRRCPGVPLLPAVARVPGALAGLHEGPWLWHCCCCLQWRAFQVRWLVCVGGLCVALLILLHVVARVSGCTL